MIYPLLKNIHLTCIVLTLISFSTRFVWMLMDSPLLKSRFSKILPHIIDSFLLASAIGLLFLLQQYPFVHHWLTAKIAGLLVYILAGTMALKRGKTKAMRSVSGALAFLSFFYITGVALTKDPVFFSG